MVVFRFAFQTSAEGVREVQKRYSKVLEETYKSENKNQKYNSLTNMELNLGLWSFMKSVPVLDLELCHLTAYGFC